MKSLIIALMSLCVSTTVASAQMQNAIRLEVASIISSHTIRMSFSHQISGKWSIATETGININRLIKGKDYETTTHWNTLSGTDSSGGERKFRDNFTEVSIYAQYWPMQIHNGPVICLGGSLKDRSGPDIIASLGYIFKIWDGIRADLMYNLYLIESIQTSKIPPSGIRIGISYVF